MSDESTLKPKICHFENRTCQRNLITIITAINSYRFASRSDGNRPLLEWAHN